MSSATDDVINQTTESKFEEEKLVPGDKSTVQDGGMILGCSTFKGIFSLKSKNQAAKERFAQRA